MNKQLDTKQLMKQYINIANDALRQQKNDIALKGVVALMDATLGGEKIAVDVVDENGNSLERFSTRFADGQFTPVRTGQHAANKQFEVTYNYIRQVVEDADNYMAHPGKLDWDWLTGQVSRTQ